MLEENVDEKYYLSDKMINCLLSESENSKYPRKDRFLQTFKNTNDKGVAATLCTTSGSRATDNYIVGNIEKWHQRGNVYSEEHSAPTICATDYKTPKLVLTKDTENYIEWEDGKNIQMNCRAWKDDKSIGTLNTGGETKILIKNNNSKGYLEASEGDGIDISSRMEYHRGTVQKDKTQTITTKGGENNGVVVLKRDLCNQIIKDGIAEEGDIVKHSYSQRILDGNKKAVEKNDGNMITLTTRGDTLGVVVKTIGNYSPSNHNASRVVDKEYVAPTVMENHGTVTATQMSDLRIRKLTPKECFRLMGVKDEDYEKCAKNQSDASLYHLAGDSIVTNCLQAIYKKMI